MDFYVILGVDRSASANDVKRAYRRLARRYHPDINPGDQEAAAIFRRVTLAYETLMNPERRQDYDAHGERGDPPAVGEVQFQGFDFSVSPAGESASTFGDLFADIFARSATDAGEDSPSQAVDLHANLKIDFADAMRGGRHELTLTRVTRCHACGGSGARRVAESRCPACAGSGQSRWTRGHMVFSRACAQCGGSGRRRERPCSVCRTEGLVSRTETVGIQVPAGIADGTRLRIAGQGSSGRRNAATGDLCVTVAVAPHPLFERDGDDLQLVVPVAVHEAALGARVTVPTIDGQATVRVPSGTQSGQRFRLRDRGAPSPHTGKPGDLVISVRIVLPRMLDERSKELLREFGRINSEDVRAELPR